MLFIALLTFVKKIKYCCFLSLNVFSLLLKYLFSPLLMNFQINNVIMYKLLCDLVICTNQNF